MIGVKKIVHAAVASRPSQFEKMLRVTGLNLNCAVQFARRTLSNRPAGQTISYSSRGGSLQNSIGQIRNQLLFLGRYHRQLRLSGSILHSSSA
jgi:hypothetical protein